MNLGMDLSLLRRQSGGYALDFDARRAVMPAGLTFTRASGAAAFPAGVAAEYASNAPRYEGGYLLIEGARQNLVVNARTIGGTGWTNSAVTPTTITGPSGVANDATRLNEGATTAAHYTSGPNTTPAGNTAHTWSALGRAATGRYMQITVASPHAGANVWANFDLLTGVLGSVGSSATAAMRAVGGGWYLCEVRGTTVASPTASNVSHIGIVNSASAARLASYAGGNLDLDAAWAQAEVGISASTPALPAVGAPLATTRAAEFLNTTPATLRLPASGVCTVLMTGNLTSIAVTWQAVLQLDDGTTDNRIYLLNQAGNTNMRLGRALAAAYSVVNAGVLTANAMWRAGVSIDGAGRVAASVDGAAAVTVTGAPTAGLTNLRIGADTASASFFGGIGVCRIMRRAVSDAELAALVANLPAAA